MGNPNEPWITQGESLARQHLADIASRHLPGLDPNGVASLLLDEPDHPAYDTVFDALSSAIAQSAQGHPRGITAEEREQLGGNRLLPDYLLGPGDQKVYGALRDSNLLNAVVGLRPVASVEDLLAGKTHLEVDGEPAFVEYEPHVVDGEVVPGFSQRWKLATAGHDYDTAAKMPTRHSTFFGGSPYPQHQMIGDPSTLTNNWKNNADGTVGQALSAFNKWSEAAKRAGRTPGTLGGHSHGIDGTVGAAAKWAVNFPGELAGAAEQEWGHNATSRASPLVPKGVSDPDLRQQSIDNVRYFSAQGSAPSVFEYGKSVGRGYSPALGWAFDMGTETADPITAATLGLGMLPRVAANVASRGFVGGVLRSLSDDVPRHLAAEGVQEATSPITLGVGALTAPRLAGAFTGQSVSPSEQADAAASLERQREQTLQSIRLLRDSRGDY